MPCMPSLARVMPVISLFIALFPYSRYWTRFPARTLLESALTCSMARRAILGVAVGIILEHLLDDFGLEFAVRALGNLGQVKVLNRVAVDVELEGAAQRGEVGLFQRRD